MVTATKARESGQVPGYVIEQIDELMKHLATGHITFHLKEGRIMEVETLVKTRV